MPKKKTIWRHYFGPAMCYVYNAKFTADTSDEEIRSLVLEKFPELRRKSTVQALVRHISLRLKKVASE